MSERENNTVAANGSPRTLLRFSILHTSARPDKWREIYDAWMSAADHPANVQYVLTVDERWGFTRDIEAETADLSNFFVCWNTERRCYVDGVNRAARESDMASDVLIVNADDQYPCPHWDTELTRLIPHAAIDTEFVIRVNTQTLDEVARNIVVMPIVSHTWYAKRGHIFYPLYESMFADNDLAESAYKSNILIEAPHLTFPHKHPMNAGAAWDKAYASQNRTTAYELGSAILARRRLNGYTNIEGELIVQSKKTIAIGLPGDTYSSMWVASWTSLFGSLQVNYHVVPLMGYSSNVYITRGCITDQIRDLDPPPDYVLWIDDDNLLTFSQFQQLLATLEAIPDADIVAAWTWIQPDGYSAAPIVSFGSLEPSGVCHPAPISCVNYGRGLEEGKPWVYGPVGYTGFPAILMRGRALDKERVGKNCFAPIMSDAHPWGFSGEDTGYSKRLTDAGGRIYVDLRVKVPHLKKQPAEPRELLEALAKAEGKAEGERELKAKFEAEFEVNGAPAGNQVTTPKVGASLPEAPALV